MRLSIRLPALATVAITGLALTLTGTAAAAAAVRGPVVARGATSAPVAASSSKLWEARYAAGGRGAFSYASAVSPDGSALFVTGGFRRRTSEHGADAATTIAYNATTGATLWQSSYNPGMRSTSVFSSIAVSPDSQVVFAAGGTQPDPGTAGPVLLVAYDAATGTALWTDTPAITGPASSVAVSPDGSTVFITAGQVTAAFNAATGAALWTASLPAPGFTGGLTVAPDGSTVFAEGTIGTSTDVVVAYNAATGATAWTDTLARLAPESLAVSPDSAAVYVTGFWGGSPGTSTAFTRTAAFDAASGAQVWANTYKSPHGGSYGSAVTVSPDSATVFVTGSTTLASKHEAAATWAYDAATGAGRWLRVLAGIGAANAVAVSPGGSTVYVTGDGSGFSGAQAFSTVAYDAVPGAQLWALVYRSPSGAWHSFANSIEVSPDSTKVFVTGDLNTPEPLEPTLAAVAYNA